MIPMVKLNTLARISQDPIACFTMSAERAWVRRGKDWYGSAWHVAIREPGMRPCMMIRISTHSEDTEWDGESSWED
ncbi:hypothetical protein LguiA_005981 [Lonicera macranthoides]